METRRRYIYAILSLAAFIALKLGIPLLHVPNSPYAKVGLLLMSVLLFMAAQIALVRWIASLDVRTWIAGVVMVVCAAAFATALKLHVNLGIGNELLLIFALCMLGRLISLIVREPNLLLPVAVFAPVFDIWTVFWGPAYTIVRKAPELVKAISANVPAPGQIQPISMIGPGDIVFLAVFFAVIYRFRMNDRQTYWLALPLLTLAMLAVVGLGGILALPALVPMGAAVIVANWRLFRLTRQEKWSMAAVGLIVLVFVAFAALR